MNNLLYGIDFVTANSASAIYQEITQSILHKIIIPLLIYLYHQPNPGNSQDYMVGEEAITAYLEDDRDILLF